MKKIISIVGARPNFMKIAPLNRAFQNYDGDIKHLICHTGQHYDKNMSKVFFDDLELPEPDYYLGVGSGSHAEQTARIMIEFEKVLLKEKPDMVIVVGDVNSTIACSLTAKKLHIPVAHVEAGLRSFDRTMPEEINRVLTDTISDMLFVTEKSGLVNLKREGIPDEHVFFTGHVMIDSLVFFLSRSEVSGVVEKLGVKPGEYVLVTLHRPANVDYKEQLMKLIDLLNNLSNERKIVFPMHPRTRSKVDEFALGDKFSENIIITEPAGYIDFLHLIKNAELILTDSGGIQEESTYLGTQCITLRDTTERPVTVDTGTNQLLGMDLEAAEKAAFKILGGDIKKGEIPELWDGKAAERIAEIIAAKL